MRLQQVAFHWERLGRSAPLEAILTEGRAQEGPWDSEAFFRTGERCVADLRARARELGLPWSGQRALDFGCGVGRLSRPLLADFQQVDGVDVAPSMLRRARQLHPSSNLNFLCNKQPHLDLLGDQSYDLVLSLITLQHLPPALTCGYLREFFRLAKPGATVFFQLPTRSHGSSLALLSSHSPKQRLLGLLPAGLLERYRLLRTPQPRMDMFGIDEEEVRALVQAAGAELLAADEAPDAGQLLPSKRYFARRRP